MGDILKSFGGGWAFLVSWVLPSAVFWYIIFTFLAPRGARQLPGVEELSHQSIADRLLVIAAASVVTGWLLNSLSTILYRALEGYYLGHGWLWRSLRRRQVKRWLKCRRRLV